MRTLERKNEAKRAILRRENKKTIAPNKFFSEKATLF